LSRIAGRCLLPPGCPKTRKGIAPESQCSIRPRVFVRSLESPFPIGAVCGI
jgi:hypothetical protein